MIAFIYLAQDRVGLKWPEVSGMTVITILFFLIMVYVIFYFINSIKARSKKKDVEWDHVLVYALKKGFTQKEISVLQGFFSGLNSVEKESFNPTLNKKNCYTMLYNYFLKQEFLDTEFKVQILGKLFFERKVDFEPKSTMDMVTGEICSLNTPSKKYLSMVLKKTESKLLLKNNNFFGEGKDQNIPVSIYFYRGGYGGFAFIGKIIAVVKEGIVFDYAGKVEKKGDDNLITSVELPFELKTWSVVRREVEDKPIVAEEIDLTDKSLEEIDELLGNKPIKSISKEKNSEKPKTDLVNSSIRNYALTEKLSNKSVQFKFVGAIPEEILRKNEVWEIKLKLPNNYTFEAKGKIMQVPNYKESFLMKFTEVTDESRQNLVSQIRQLGIDRD